MQNYEKKTYQFLRYHELVLNASYSVGVSVEVMVVSQSSSTSNKPEILEVPFIVGAILPNRLLELVQFDDVLPLLLYNDEGRPKSIGWSLIGSNIDGDDVGTGDTCRSNRRCGELMGELIKSDGLLYLAKVLIFFNAGLDLSLLYEY
jgi:hypothetical protein